jgi:hypothetical protein
MPTYELTINSCNSQPSIKATFEHIPASRLRRAFEFAIRTFRQVDATDEETGQVIFSHYVDADWHESVYNEGEALDILVSICYNPDNE